MQIKDDSVNIWGLQVEMQPVLKAAETIWTQFGHEVVITSARDGMHSAGSLHYYGYAVDLRTRYFTDMIKTTVATNLREVLGNKYDVIIHGSHIHVEYDPR